jgi:hypothetical protein
MLFSRITRKVPTALAVIAIPPDDVFESSRDMGSIMALFQKRRYIR